jgi:hypothetical protein
MYESVRVRCVLQREENGEHGKEVGGTCVCGRSRTEVIPAAMSTSKKEKLWTSVVEKSRNGGKEERMREKKKEREHLNSRTDQDDELVVLFRSDACWLTALFSLLNP